MFFWKPDGEFGSLSNWSNHQIKEGDLVFPTTEHYLMYHKALLMDDQKTAKLVLGSRTPLEAKRLGRQVKPWDEELWCRERGNVMLKGLTLKANQHSEVKRLLLGTNGQILAEASPYDKVWGIGLDEKNPKASQRSQWRGENLLGKSWMAVRGILLSDE